MADDSQTRTIEQRSPSRASRGQVLNGDPAMVAELLRSNPGKWYVIGSGNHSRRATLAQTAFRINSGQAASFGTEDGERFVTRVSSSKSDDKSELFCRFIPAGLWGNPDGDGLVARQE